METTAKHFIRNAFDYLSSLVEVSVDRSVNRYLIEFIAYGFVQYGTVKGFIEHADEWVRKANKVFKELTFDHSCNQVLATIDLIDQVVVIDDDLYNALEYVINIQKQYGLHVIMDGNRMTIAQFFENVEKKYPVIKDRYKGLGSSNPKVLHQLVMDPKTRCLYRVNADDIRTMQVYDMLVGKSKDAIIQRKEMMMDFKWKPSDIDT